MNEQTCVATAVCGHGTELIGTTVYFEAIRALKVGQRKGRPTNNNPQKCPGNKPFYDLIPGTVRELTPRGVVIEGAGKGIYNRTMADIVRPEDLDRWMRINPFKLVLRGTV